MASKIQPGDKLAFYGGSSLGRDLSLPRLREIWPAPGVEAAGEAAAEWQAAFRGQAPTTSNGRESLGLDGLTANAQEVAAAGSSSVVRSTCRVTKHSMASPTLASL